MLPSTVRNVRPGPAIAAFGCFVVGGFLAWHYPLAPVLASVAFAAACLGAFARPDAWLFAVPALLPGIGLASWTGWMAFEEFDLLVLAAAAGGYAALTMRSRERHDTHASSPMPGAESHGGAVPNLPWYARALVIAFSVSILVGLYRGIASATTQGFGWFDGYDDALNSLRIAKGFFLVLLVLPLLQVELRRQREHSLDLLASGLVVGLTIASLAVVWERMAFTGLLNFSTNYRATGPFWEMHVGGAALDGYLALTAPFAVWQLLRAASPLRLAIAGGVALLAGYACLATFSRGLYIALPISIGLLALLVLRQSKSPSFASTAVPFVKGCAWSLVTAAGAYIVFRAGGYRSLLAVLGAVALMLPLRASARVVGARSWLTAVAFGSVLAAAGGLAATTIPKGNYVIFAAACACCAVLSWRERRAVGARSPIPALAAFVWTLVAAAIVAYGWGGDRALRDSAAVLLLLLVLTVWNSRASARLWPEDLKSQGAIIGAAALVAISVAVFSGGAYMGERFGASERDLEGRLQHWHDGITMLHTPADWLLGKGLGRFPQSYVFDTRDHDVPGEYRIGVRDQNRLLALSGPRREGGFGQMLRVSQRVPIIPGGQYSIVLDVHAARAALLHLEVCEQHLLYNGGCAIAKVMIESTEDSPRRKVAVLDGRRLSGGPWYAPRLAFFAMAVETPEGRVDIDNISVLGPDGRDVIVNGNFGQGMARWFITSDRMHLPWHIKNVGLAVVFDQGLSGLACFALLVGAALARVIVGGARRQPAAPFLAAATVGFLVVGAFDSLLDVPRLAFLFYLLVILSLILPGNDRKVAATPRQKGSRTLDDTPA